MSNEKKIYAVLGLGKFGQSVALSLTKKGYEVLAIDTLEENVQAISDDVTHSVVADATDIDALRSLGIRNYDVVIISIGADMQSSIMATLLVKELGAKSVIAKASSLEHKKVLEKIGADKVIFPENEMGKRIATNLISSNIVDYIELSSDYSIVEIAVLPEWVGKALEELNLRQEFGVNIMAIRRRDQVYISFDAETILNENDVLVVIGENKKLNTIYNTAQSV